MQEKNWRYELDRYTMILQNLTAELDHFLTRNADAQQVCSVYMLLPKEKQDKVKGEIFEAVRSILLAYVSAG